MTPKDTENEEHPSLEEWVLYFQPDAVRREECLFFDPMPLVLAAAPVLSVDHFYECVAHAIDDGYGDPIDLRESDSRQMSRFEDAFFELATNLSLEEILVLQYESFWGDSPEHTLCMARSKEGALLLLHDACTIPSFTVLAVGSEPAIMAHLAREYHVLLPFIGSEYDRTIRVIIRKCLEMDLEAVLGIVRTLTGDTIHPSQVIAQELLDCMREDL